MSIIGATFKQLVANMFSIFVYGEVGNLETRRGQTKSHTAGQQKRLRMSARLITRLNLWLLRVSKGRIGNSFLGRPLLLLTTIGRKSGVPRTQPIFYLQQDERILLVASNGGYAEDPLWLMNARANPKVTVSIRGRSRDMYLRIVSDAEKAQLWPSMAAAFPYWQEVSDRCERNIPVAVLEPHEPG